MPLKVWDGSAWQVQAQIKVWNGSSWVALNDINNAKTARVWNGSSWVQFHPGVQLQEFGAVPGEVELFAFGLDFASAFAEVELILDANGTAKYRYSTNSTPTTDFLSYSWLLTGANSDYYAYMDAPAGDAYTSGSATGTALQLNTTRSWILGASQAGSGSDSKSNSSTLRIRTASGVDIVTIPVLMSADATVF
jgi:hypothetical protein